MSASSWQTRTGFLDLSTPRIMGILNVTPNSFSDGGRYLDPADALHRAVQLVEAGADLIDIGGESTRPGSKRVNATEQLKRVLPAIQAIRSAGLDIPISIDTTLAEVAEGAIEAGASIINDIAAGTESEAMLDLAARTGAGLVLMHRRMSDGAPADRSVYPTDPDYPGGVLRAVRDYLAARVAAAIDAGVQPAAIVLDPGLGFGKSTTQNYQLITGTADLLALGYPLLSAASRKSFIGAVTGVEDAADRVPGSVAITVSHFQMGVQLFRVHDVADHRQALAVAMAIRDGE